MRAIIQRKDAMAHGLIHYYTGKPCRRGHNDVRFVKGGCCKSCRYEDLQRHRENPEYCEMVRQSGNRWKKENAEILRQKRKDKWATNEDYRAKCKRYFFANYDKILASYRAENMSQTRRDRLKKWRKDNYWRYAETIKLTQKVCNARRRSAEGKFTKNDVLRMLNEQNYKCRYCGKCVKSKYHIDHIMPLKLGGTNWPFNLQILCPNCNLRKSSCHPDEWLKRIGRL